MRILIVDDDDIATDVLANALAQFGHHVTSARDGFEALELIRSGAYRLVVLDWEMPGMSGIELCRHIRERYSSGYVYIILLTARHGTAEHRRRPQRRRRRLHHQAVRTSGTQRPHSRRQPHPVAREP